MSNHAPLAPQTDTPPQQAGTPQVNTTPSGTLESAALLQGAKAISISHNGAIYRLQATKLGKLILTK